jgi:O-antigen/teichoic acid export membrane protein
LRALPRAATDNPLRRVAQNTAFPIVAALVNKALDLCFAVVTFRVLGPADVGTYVWIGLIVGYLDILLSFGMNTWLTRELARRPGELSIHLGNVLAVRGGLWLAVMLVPIGLAGPLAGTLDITPDVALALMLLGLAMAPSGVAAALSAAFQAYERMEYPAAVTVITTVLKIALGLLALGLGYGFVGLAGVALIVNCVTLAILGLLFASLVGWPRLHFAPGKGFAIARDAYPYMLNNFLASLFFRLDGLLLRPLAGDAALGWYNAGYRVIDGLNLLPAHLTLALFPMLAREAESDRTRLARVYKRALKLLILIALPTSVGIALVAEPLLGLLAGSAYLPEAGWALQVLIWFLPFSFVNGVTQYVLIAVGYRRLLTAAFVVATLFNLGANLVLIPRFGYLAAAAVTVLSEIVLLAPFWWAVGRALPAPALPALVWRPLLAAAGMGLVLMPLVRWSWLLSIPVGAVVYFALLVLLRAFDAEDRELWRRLRGRNADPAPVESAR